MDREPLTEQEKREREEARAQGRKMAKGSIAKLQPQIQAITQIINEHNDLLIREAKREERKRIMGVIEGCNSIAFPYGADFKSAILQALKQEGG